MRKNKDLGDRGPGGRGREPSAVETPEAAGADSFDLDPQATSAHAFLMLHREARRDESAPDSAERLAAALEAAGFKVTTSRSAVESKRRVGDIRPSILILDPLVCSADGVEFELAASLQTKEDPIPLLVIVEALDELQEIRRVPALFKDFLVRPFSAEEFAQRTEQALVAKQRYLALQFHARKLEGEVIRDFKTGLYVERHFRHLLGQEFQRAERHRSPLSFLLIDIDDFKQVNDQNTYSFGDYVIAQFADILRHSIREIDHAARFGGDEFMVLLPNTSPAEAVQVAGRIRQQIERRVFEHDKCRMRCTTSIGIDTYDGRGRSTPEELRYRANLALKEAKTRGKNKIWLYSGSERQSPPAAPPEARPQTGDSLGSDERQEGHREP